MGHQQLLLVVIGLVIIAIGIAIGVLMFGSTSIETNKQAIVSQLNTLASGAYQYLIRPETLGGGGGTYTGGGGFKIPAPLQSNDNGTFTVTNSPRAITFTATSAQGFGTITAVCDSTGQIRNFSYSGEFL